MLRLGMEEDVPIESKMITKRIARRAEGGRSAELRSPQTHSRIRRRDEQAAPGDLRHGAGKLLEGHDQKRAHSRDRREHRRVLSRPALPRKLPASDKWDWAGLQTDMLTQFGVQDEHRRIWRRWTAAKLEDAIVDLLKKRYEEKERLLGPEIMRETERMIMLNVIDNQWKDHLLSMDHLKEGIGLRGYGQKDPLVEYKKESRVMFDDMIDRIEDETVRFLFFLQRVGGQPSADAVSGHRRR